MTDKFDKFNSFLPSKIHMHYAMNMSLVTTFVFGLILRTAFSFQPLHSTLSRRQSSTSSTLASVAVSIDELEKDLTPPEKSITAVVRNCGPSVAFVTSIYPNTPQRQQSNNKYSGIPPGRELGSGSGFQVTVDGYVCTNYHVIERAYTIQQAIQNLDTMLDQVAGNVTSFLPKELVDFFLQSTLRSYTEVAPVVYVRINSDTKYQKCQIVNVEPYLDLAVLKIIRDDGTESSSDNTATSISFGSSSDLLVGQSVVAIGNPFGLDKTVTTGVVSAVNREFRAGTARTPANTPIRDCIQTDAAINPGNSGGPLLNLKGQVVGINTAIITTSGSNAGIGFAVPADQLKPAVDQIIQQDKNCAKRGNKGWLGVSIVQQPISVGNSTKSKKNWVANVDKGSPAKFGGIQPLQIQDNGTIKLGDAIVAVAGNDVSSFAEFQAELQDRVKGEQISLTLEDADGEKRVVYITLGQKDQI